MLIIIFKRIIYALSALKTHLAIFCLSLSVFKVGTKKLNKVPKLYSGTSDRGTLNKEHLSVKDKSTRPNSYYSIKENSLSQCVLYSEVPL